MFGKRSLLVLLAGVNVALAVTLILSVYQPKQALAQRRGAAGDYVAVTSQADPNYDVIYILDLPDRMLHAFLPNRDRSGRIGYAGARNLAVDFER